MDAFITIFKEYAQKTLKEQAAEVKKHYHSKESANRSKRLKVFNDHLDVLKGQLEAKMNVLVTQQELKSSKEKLALEKKLAALYDECIHEFLKKDFDVNT